MEGLPQSEHGGCEHVHHFTKGAPCRQPHSLSLTSIDQSDSVTQNFGNSAITPLGYQAESATWRNAYLQGAHELRNGIPQNLMRAPISVDVVQALTVPLFFDYLAVRLNGSKAEGKHIVINWVFPDLAERYVLNLENCALTYLTERTADNAHVTVTLARPVLSQLILQHITLANAIHEGVITIEGDGGKLSELFELIDEFRFMFHILEPRHEP